MKTLRLNPSVAGLLLLMLMAAGCEHKKPVLVMPQQPPPTATPQATPTPAATEAQPSEQPQEAQSTPTPDDQSKAGEKTAEKTKPKHPRHTATKKPSDKAEVARNTPPKKVIPAEPAPTPQQISPGPTNGGSNQASTDQLLQGAETNLNGITRQLSKDEEAMRAQIREFIKQSRTATTENDPARAHTLAVKARLLSDELVKQR
jgi:outer membrane biosynthesis protein TonB